MENTYVSGSFRLPQRALLRIGVCFALLLITCRGAFGTNLSTEEQLIADYLVSDPAQGRGTMTLNPILAQVARARAVDMATRNYFSHVNPSGFGPNYLVQAAGYPLPASWNSLPASNNIESIAAGSPTAAGAWQSWMGSVAHRTHILGLQPIYASQTSYGVGYAYSANSLYRHYWVILTAPPAVTSEHAALYLSHTAPSTMIPGQSYSVSVTMLNTGTTVWSEGNQYRLGSRAPTDNFHWGTNRVTFPGDVQPGSSVAISFIVDAPSLAGGYNFQWQMIAENSEWFGEETPGHLVLVASATDVPQVSGSHPKEKKKKKKKKKKK